MVTADTHSYDNIPCPIVAQEDLSTYYQVFNRHRPEMGESNAESVDRMRLIEEEILHIQAMRNKRKRVMVNNVQDVQLTSDYYLYENQDQPITEQPIPILFDTGAALTMISSHSPTAWCNLRECMFNISGCFKGLSFPDLQMGEYHGVMTLDSGETVHIIIPEAIQLPAKLSHSNLLANTAYPMAGHNYVSDLYKSKLKSKGGGQYTLEVTRGHHVFKVLPIPADKQTAHRTIYLHNNHPYDPPTFMNEIHYQNTNRANLQTPTAFIWHLRYACKSADSLKHTQQHVNGMNVQMGSWIQLKQILPCSACLAAKMRKANKTPRGNYTDVNNCAISWTPGTNDKISTPNNSFHWIGR